MDPLFKTMTSARDVFFRFEENRGHLALKPGDCTTL
jgi:hypothetical protein